ncbi:MAG: DpnD/PcfM family protein [Wujia sp.]
MTSYEIEIQELLSRIVTVEADSTEEAVNKVQRMYEKEQIILDAEDVKEVNIKKYEDRLIINPRSREKQREDELER